MKLPHQSTVNPLDGVDVVPRDYVNRRILSIYDFASDDTGTTDEAAGIQAGLDAVSGTDDILDLGGGTWRFDTQLLMKDRCRVENGRLLGSVADTGLKATNSLIRAHQDSEIYSVPILRNVTIERLQFADKIGFQCERGLRIQLVNVFFRNFDSTLCQGIRLLGVQGGQFINVDVDGHGSHALEATGLSGFTVSTDCQFIGCRFINGITAGHATIKFPAFAGAVGATSFSFVGGGAENTAGNAVEIFESGLMRFQGFRFEGFAAGYGAIKIENPNNSLQCRMNIFDKCSSSNNDLVTPLIDIGADVYETRLLFNLLPSSSVKLLDNGTNTRAFGNDFLTDFAFNDLVVSVYRYAVDDTGATDEAANLQTAIDEVSATDKILDLGGGSWRFDTQLEAKDRCHIVNGRLIGNVADTGNKETNSLIRAFQDAETFSIFRMDSVTIRRLSNDDKIGLQVERGSQLSLSNIRFENFRNTECLPLRLMNVAGGLVTGLDVDGYGSSAVEVTGLTGFAASQDVTFISPKIRDGLTVGEPAISFPAFGVIAGANLCSFYGGSVQNSFGNAIEIFQSQSLRFSEMRFSIYQAGYGMVKITNPNASLQCLLNTFTSCISGTNDGVTPIIDIGADVNKTTLIGNTLPGSGVPLLDNGDNTLSFGNFGIPDFGTVWDVADPSETVAELQARIDTKGILYLGDGTYDLGTTGLVVNGVGKVIRGVGYESILTHSGSGIAIHVGAVGASDVVLKDFKLVGTAKAGVGIEFGGVNSTQPKMLHVEVEEFDIGLNMVVLQIGQFRDNWIHDNRDAIVVGTDEDNFIIATLIDHNRINLNDEVGIRVKSAIHVELTGNTIEGNGHEAILFETDRAGAGFSIADVLVEKNFLENNNLGRGAGFAEVAVTSIGAQATGPLRTTVRENTFGPLFGSDFQWSFHPTAASGLDSYLWYKNRTNTPYVFENSSNAFFIQFERLNSDAIPTTGFHFLGEVVFNRLPSAGENVGWICVAEGTPGTWLEWGADIGGDGSLDAAYDVGDTITVDADAVEFLQPARVGGTPRIFNVTGGINTALAAGLEAFDVFFSLGRTVEWTAGPLIANQRAFVIGRPTYAATAAQTINIAATMYLQGAPLPGANMTLSNAYALWVDDGIVRIDGALHLAASAAGSAADPSLRLVDANTGIFRPASSVFAIETFQTEAVRWDGFQHQRNAGNIFILERAAAAADVTGYGQIWIKDDAPNKLMFTDDGGTDYDVLAPTVVSLDDAYDAGSAITVDAGAVDLTQPAIVGGTPRILNVTGGANTALATLEAFDVFFSLGRTVEFTAGPLIANQRAFVVARPTYAATAAQTINIAATMYLQGDPLPGANMTLSNAYALWIDGGIVRSDGPLYTGFDHAGTAADPHIRLVDANAGIYSPSTSNVAIETAQMEAVRWDSLQNQRNAGTLFLLEKAVAAPDQAGYGQLWVKDDTPNVLMFTDDAGTDFDVIGSTTSLDDAYDNGSVITVDSGAVEFTQPAIAGGTPRIFNVNGGANTALATLEAFDVFFSLGRTVEFTAGAPLANQRAFVIARPTYSATAAQTINIAATMYLQGEPLAGTNMTLSNAYALWVDNGIVRVDGQLQVAAENAGTAAAPAIQLVDANTGIFRPAGSTFAIETFQTEAVRWDGSQHQRNAGNIFLLEKSAAAADVTSYGQLWVKDSSPNVLMFTDDAGTDFDLLAPAAPVSLDSAYDNGSVITVDAGAVELTQPATVGGTPRILNVNGGANTALATLEAFDVFFSLGRTVEFTAGATIANQRAFVVGRPTYAATAAQTINIAATMYLQGAPLPGANMSLSNSYALWVDDGTVRMDGRLEVAASTPGSAVTPAVQIVDANTGFFRPAGSTLAIETFQIEAVRWDGSQHQRNAGNIFLLEKSAASADVAAYGQLWVKDDAPNVLMFTNDAGTDFDISTPAAAVSLDSAYDVGDTITVDAGPVELTQPVIVGGTPRIFNINGGANTGLAAGLEARDVFFNLGRTVEFTAGASISNQRAFLITRPTYAATAAQVIDTAATMYLQGEPLEGANMTINNSFALFVDNGISRLDGNVHVGANLDGSVTDPEIRIVDVNSGIFRPASSSVGISTFQTEAVRWDGSQHQRNAGNIFLLEKAAAAADVAAYGQLWVKDSTPNVLMFTNDAGTDFDLLAPPAPTSLDDAYNAGETITVDAGAIAFTQPAIVGGSPRIFNITGGAHTALATSEAFDILFALNRTVEFTAGAAIANQRSIVINRPTYAATAPQSISAASTIYLRGEPLAGANMSFGQAYALWVDDGTVRIDGALHLAASAAGTPGNPSLRLVDVTTGIYRPAAGEFAIVSGSAEAVRWNTTQEQFNRGNIYILETGAASADVTTYGQLWMKNDAPNKFMFTDDLGTDFNVIQGLNDAYQSGDTITVTGGNPVEITQAAEAGGTPRIFNINGGANTALTAGLEAFDIFFSLGRTVEWTAGATINNQRAIAITRPTYAATAAQTISNAATIYLQGEPLAGANMTISNSYALWVDDGTVKLDGEVRLGSDLFLTAGNIDIVQETGITGVSKKVFDVTASIQLALNANTEAPDVVFGLNRGVQFTAGTGIATQRAFQIFAPTYSATAAETISEAATLYVNGAPGAGTNMTLTERFALWIDTGVSRFDGDVQARSNLAVTNDATITGDIDAGGGMRRTLPSMYLTSPAQSTEYTPKVDGNLAGFDHLGWFVFPRAGSVVEMSVWVASNITAGKVDFWVQRSTNGGDGWVDHWGSAASPVCTLDTSAPSDEYDFAIQAKDVSAFSAGHVLRIRALTDGTFNAGKTIVASVGVEF